MKKKKIDKKEDKATRIATAIANMDNGETIKPTALFRSIQIHPNTGRDILDYYDSLKEIGFKTIRDKNRKIIEIIKHDESLNQMKEIREIRKEQLNLRNDVEEVKSILKQIVKKLKKLI